MIEALYLHLKRLTGIHCEFIYDSLSEDTMIQVGVPESLYGRLTESLPEETVDKLEAWAKQTGWHHKDIGEDIEEPDIYPPQHSYQPTVHQPVTIGRTSPLFLSHYPTFFSI